MNFRNRGLYECRECSYLLFVENEFLVFAFLEICVFYEGRGFARLLFLRKHGLCVFVNVRHCYLSEELELYLCEAMNSSHQHCCEFARWWFV